MKTFKESYEEYLSETGGFDEIKQLDEKITEELRLFVPTHQLTKIDNLIADLCAAHEERAFRSAYLAGIKEAIG